MIYLTQPSTLEVRQAISTHPRIGQLKTPVSGHRLEPGTVWAADNSCFNAASYPGDDAWRAWLGAFTDEQRARCMFATAPDVVGDFAATVERSAPWLERIRDAGFPVALVAQDGMEWSTWDCWDDIDCLFIGGTDAFKLGEAARELSRLAGSLGKHVHVGRVNSLKRLRYAASPSGMLAHSADGTYVSFGPDKNLRRLQGWLTDLDVRRELDYS